MLHVGSSIRYQTLCTSSFHDSKQKPSACVLFQTCAEMLGDCSTKETPSQQPLLMSGISVNAHVHSSSSKHYSISIGRCLVQTWQCLPEAAVVVCISDSPGARGFQGSFCLEPCLYRAQEG